MALISMRQMLDHAAEFGYGVPAFNVNNLEQMRAIMEAADKTDSPVIVQASAGARKYAGAPFLRSPDPRRDRRIPAHPGVHAPGPRHQPGRVPALHPTGLSSVMMDGSLGEDGKTPTDYEYNVRVTQQTVAMAHACGVSVEGELGCLVPWKPMLTDPEEAADFVKKTQVDALAIAIGTSHGAYKFTRKPTGDILSIARIKEIHARLPNTHLVMHGSSSVPQEWLAIINQYGGNMKETYGVPVEEIQEAIKYGVRKINIDTDLRPASTGAMRRLMATNPSEFDPRKFFGATVTAMRDVCIARYEAFWDCR
ncbi:fructose-bisphosphate aldolase class-II domain-containing protein [Ditylenchus destructor]|nr:fructose-bisphosphate aldolase class-II domain-containing protein [Ditylenchus destructor]